VGSGPVANPASLVGVGQDFVRAEGDKVEMLGTGSSLSFVQFTAETWVRTPDVTVPDDYYLVTQSLYCDLPESWTLNIADDTGHLNEARFAIKESNTQTSVYGTVVTGGGWHHLVGVRTTTDILIYVDGILRGTIADLRAGQTILSTSNISIGSAICVPDEDANGTIDEVRISTGVRSPDWISTTYNSLSSPLTFFTLGPEEGSPPTAVALSGFSASPAAAGIRLDWETASEIRNLGFHLYRSLSLEGPFERITSALIAGLGSTPHGRKYDYVDETVVPGLAYYYELEDVDVEGSCRRHGPVSAVAGGGAGGRVPFGDPGNVSLRVLSSDRRGVRLELLTFGLEAELGAGGTARIHVAGFDDSGPLPVKRSWVEAVVGRKVAIERVEEEDFLEVPGLRPEGADASELVAFANGSVRRRDRRGAQTPTDENGSKERPAARILETGFQGETKKALLEIAPFRWDERKEMLVLARRVVVDLAFVGREPSESVKGARAGRRHLEASTHRSRRVLARFRVAARGLYRVRYEDLPLPRRSVRPLEDVRLSRRGEAVAFHLEPRGKPFGPGSTLYFMSDGERLNAFDTAAVYELETTGVSVPMPIEEASPSGSTAGVFLEPVEREENRLYQAALLDAGDLWLWDVIPGEEAKEDSVELADLVSGPAPGRIQLRLEGGSDFPEAPDHHVRVRLNGNVVAEDEWDGRRSRSLEASLLPGSLVEGTNRLRIENVGDTGAAYSMIFLDGYRLTVPRLAKTDRGLLEGGWSESGTAEVSIGGDTVRILDVSEAPARWLVGAERTGGVLRFRVEAGRRYLLVSEPTVLSPVIMSSRATDLRDEENGADYLAVGPSDLLSGVAPLLRLRQREGLLVRAASWEDVYHEFGHGEPTPQSLQDFLSYAYHHWKRAPRFVLLLGDTTYDFKDRLQTGIASRLPSLPVKTHFLWTISDPLLGAVNGPDRLPDVAVGRLPARTREEVRAMVQKVLEYERSAARLSGPVIFVADDRDSGGDFPSHAAELAASIGSDRPVQVISLEALGREKTREAVFRGFSEGPSLLSYVGHGGIHLWADEGLLTNDDVPRLDPDSRLPLVLTMNCLNGYFHFPYFDALGETLVKTPDRGALAAISPSGMSLNEPAEVFHRLLLEELFSGSHARLGDALLAAQSAYAATEAFPDLLSIFHLFGDPALRLR
jgi:hypothetical protein